MPPGREPGKRIAYHDSTDQAEGGTICLECQGGGRNSGSWFRWPNLSQNKEGGKHMQGDTIKCNRKSLRSDRAKKRSQLGGSDRNRIGGKFEELYRFLEERYGFSEEQAKKERRIRR